MGGLGCIRRKTLGGIPRTAATSVRAGGGPSGVHWDQAVPVFVPAVGQEPTGTTAAPASAVERRGGGASLRRSYAQLGFVGSYEFSDLCMCDQKKEAIHIYIYI